MSLREKIQHVAVDGTSNIVVQLLRYVVVGGIAFVVDFGLLWVLTEYAGLHYLVSATISFIAGLVVNYLLSVVWVFGSSKLRSKWAEFGIYAVIGVIGLGLNNLLLWLLTDYVGLDYRLSKIITAALVMLWNFFARRLLFKNEKKTIND